MTGPADAHDEALEQALQAQLAPRAYQDGWRSRYAVAADGSALSLPNLRDSLAIADTAAQVEGDSAGPGAALRRPGPSGAAAATDGAAQIPEAKQAARPKPIPPPRSAGQRQAALDAARQRNAELKALRARLRRGELTLAELLAQARSEQAAGRMLLRTALMALPGIRAARASQLMAAAGIHSSRRAGALSVGQRSQLITAFDALRL